MDTYTDTTQAATTSAFMNEPPGADYRSNRQYKDSLFRTLFKLRELFISLYNAISGSHYTVDDITMETTLDDPLFVGYRNDVAFLIDDRLAIFIEHQSTVNENIALRFLAYVVRTYEKILDWKKVYGTQAVSIPRPEFYVIYNGTDKNVPPVHKERLSKLFRNKSGIDLSTLPFTLDLEVTIFNINTDIGHELLSRCEPLKHYQLFVELVQQFKKDTNNPDTAMEMARNECRKRGILTKYLPKPITEVDAMQLCEVTEEDVYELWKEEAHEKGRQEGRQEGIQEGIQKGIQEVFDILRQKGYPVEELINIIAQNKPTQ